MRRVASIPLMPGRLMSISTTSGCAIGRQLDGLLARLGLGRPPRSPGAADHGPGHARNGRLIVDDQDATTVRRLVVIAVLGSHARCIVAHQARRRPGCGAPDATGVLAPLLLGEVEQHGLDPAVDVGLLGQAELGEQRVDVLLDRPLARGPATAATAALFLPCAISPSTSRSRGVSRSSGDSRPARPGRDQHLDDLGSTTEPPAATSRMAATSCSPSETRSFSR